MVLFTFDNKKLRLAEFKSTPFLNEISTCSTTHANAFKMRLTTSSIFSFACSFVVSRVEREPKSSINMGRLPSQVVNHHRFGFNHNLSRMDGSNYYGSHHMDPTMLQQHMDENNINQVQDFPKDFYPPPTAMIAAKKYSSTVPNKYKHVIVPSTTKFVLHASQKKPKKTKKKDNRKDDSWFEHKWFGCESDYEEDYED